MPLPVRLLFSFHYFKNENLSELLAPLMGMGPIDIFADSGAFSAWTKGATITVKEYADWLIRWRHIFTCAASLDVIGDGEASWAQTEDLRGLLNPDTPDWLIPVFHSNDRALEDGTHWSGLERYLKAGYQYIGISPTGAIYTNAKLMKAWLGRCFAMRPPEVKYHGFGVTGWQHIERVPWYSVDSASWKSGFMYATPSLFDSRRGKMIKLNMRNNRELLERADLLKLYGLRPTQMLGKKYDHELMCGTLVKSSHFAEEWIAKRRAPTKIYMVSSPGKSADGSAQMIAAGIEKSKGLHR